MMAETTTKSERVRQRLITGEAFRVADVSEEFNVYDPLVYSAKKEMTARGYRFESVSDEGGHFRCVNPEHEPSQSQMEFALSVRRTAWGKKSPKSPPKHKSGSESSFMIQAEVLLTSGQWVNFGDMAKRIGCSTPLISLAKRGLEKAGYTFEQRWDGQRSEWRCLNPDTSAKTRSYTPEEVEARRVEAVKKQELAAERAQHAKQAVANGHTLALADDPGPSVLGVPMEATMNGNPMIGTPLPFGGNVQVFAMILKDDGGLRFGIQAGETRWFADVVGEVKR